MVNLVRENEDKLAQKILDYYDWQVAWHPIGMITADSKNNLLNQMKQKKNLFDPSKSGNLLNTVADAMPGAANYGFVGQIVKFSTERHNIISEQEWNRAQDNTLRLMMYMPLGTDNMQFNGLPYPPHVWETLDTKTMTFKGPDYYIDRNDKIGAHVYVNRK